MKLNISAKEFIALYAMLSAGQAQRDDDAEPLKQLRDRMKAFLIGSLTRSDDPDDPKLAAWKEWEKAQEKRIEDLRTSSGEFSGGQVSVSVNDKILTVPVHEFDTVTDSQYPRKQSQQRPPQPNMPKFNGKGHGKRR